jgi:5-methyltetrahydrofolate--homocysteine methyltransferase
VACAADYGIARKDIIVDPLTLTISSGADNALVTLEALRRLRDELGVCTMLGVSNISFGLPERESLNAAFLAMATLQGLSAAIANPHSDAMRAAFHSAKALTAQDAQCAAYIAHAADKAQTASANHPAAPSSSQHTLEDAVRLGLKKEAGELAAGALAALSPMAIIDQSIIPALNAVGRAFEKGTLYLPQLLMSAEAAKAAFAVLKQALGGAGVGRKGVVVVATVEGDIHDIGKNIAKAMLENYQFQVIDLGKDVKSARVVEAARESGARLIGLSALMTTTVDNMRATIAAIRRELPGCRVMVGGAVLTEAYAAQIGADRYVKDALQSVRYAQTVYADCAEV